MAADWLAPGETPCVPSFTIQPRSAAFALATSLIHVQRDQQCFGPDLAKLLSLLEHKKLDPQIGWRGDWKRVAEAADALLERRVLGKAVLDVTR